MVTQTILMVLLASFLAWEVDMEKPKPYPLANGDTLMVRVIGYDFCPEYCDIDHFHVGHKKNYTCEVDSCHHMVYEDRLN